MNLIPAKYLKYFYGGSRVPAWLKKVLEKFLR